MRIEAGHHSNDWLVRVELVKEIANLNYCKVPGCNIISSVFCELGSSGALALEAFEPHTTLVRMVSLRMAWLVERIQGKRGRPCRS